MGYTPRLLTDDQIEGFITRGAVHLPGAIPAELAERCARVMLANMRIDEHDPETWRHLRGKPHRPAGPDDPVTWYRYDVHAPRLWQAMCDLVGGPDRIQPDMSFRDNGVYTLADPDVLKLDHPIAQWKPPLPSEGRGGWHVDGSTEWFAHYLDSPQVGLLILILFRDATKLGGATWYAPQSPPLVARHYAANPDGRPPKAADILKHCTEFAWAQGKAGDAFLLHPFMMHTASPSVLPQPRLMENDNMSLAEPMRFDRENPADFSVLERSILRYLGVDSLEGFTRKGPDRFPSTAAASS